MTEKEKAPHPSGKLLIRFPDNVLRRSDGRRVVISPKTRRPIAFELIPGEHQWGEAFAAAAQNLKGRLPYIEELKTIFDGAECSCDGEFDGDPDLVGPFVWSSTEGKCGIRAYNIRSGGEACLPALCGGALALVVEDLPDVTPEP